MEGTLMIPLELTKISPALEATNNNVKAEEAQVNQHHVNLDKKGCERKYLQGRYNHFTDVKTADIITTKIEDLNNQNRELNDLNNDMREKTHQIRNYNHTLANIDENLGLTHEENVRL